MDLNKELVKQIRGLIIFTAFVILCFWQHDLVLGVISSGLGIIMPFIIGGAIAFVLNVPMSFIEKKLFGESNMVKDKLHKDEDKLTNPEDMKGSITTSKEKNTKENKWARPVSLLLTITALIGIIVLVFYVVVPQLAQTFQSLGASIQAFLPTVATWAGDLFNNTDITNVILNFEYDWQVIISYGFNFLQQGAGSVVGTTVDVAMTLVSAITTFFIAFVFAIYILLQKEILAVQGKKVIFAFTGKGRAEATIEVLGLSRDVFSSFLTGQCVEAVIIGLMFVVVLFLFKIPYALLIGIIIGFTALIPVFGAFLGCAMGAFLIFIESPSKAITFLIIFIVIQQIEGNLIYPFVVGNSVGLPSIWVLAAVSVGASLMGVVGMLIFIPITSVSYALFREVVYIKLRKNNIDFKEINDGKLG